MTPLERDIFLSHVRQVLRDEPDLFSEVIKAATSGMTLALKDRDKEIGQKTVALTCAISLIQAKRVTGDLKKRLTNAVIRGLEGDAAVLSPIEREFMEENNAQSGA